MWFEFSGARGPENADLDLDISDLDLCDLDLDLGDLDLDLCDLDLGALDLDDLYLGHSLSLSPSPSLILEIF